jgi:hypothetical protein
MFRTTSVGNFWTDSTTPTLEGSSDIASYNTDGTNFPFSKATVVVSGSDLVLRLQRDVAAVSATITKFMYEITFLKM